MTVVATAVVQDGKVLTWRGPGTAIKLSLALVDADPAPKITAGRSRAGQTIARRAPSFYHYIHTLKPPEIAVLIREILTFESDAIYSIEPTDSVESAVAPSWFSLLGVGSLVVLKTARWWDC